MLQISCAYDLVIPSFGEDGNIEMLFEGDNLRKLTKEGYRLWVSNVPALHGSLEIDEGPIHVDLEGRAKITLRSLSVEEITLGAGVPFAIGELRKA